jgi:hypothetical protein
MLLVLHLSYGILSIQIGRIDHVELRGPNSQLIENASCETCICQMLMHNYSSLKCFPLDGSCAFFVHYNTTHSYDMQPKPSSRFYFVTLPPISSMSMTSVETSSSKFDSSHDRWNVTFSITFDTPHSHHNGRIHIGSNNERDDDEVTHHIRFLDHARNNNAINHPTNDWCSHNDIVR